MTLEIKNAQQAEAVRKSIEVFGGRWWFTNGCYSAEDEIARVIEWPEGE